MYESANGMIPNKILALARGKLHNECTYSDRMLRIHISVRLTGGRPHLNTVHNFEKLRQQTPIHGLTESAIFSKISGLTGIKSRYIYLLARFQIGEIMSSSGPSAHVLLIPDSSLAYSFTIFSSSFIQ
jgi:hypothetical protein